MVSVIRDNEQSRNLPAPRRGGIWKFLLLILAIICLFLGLYYAPEYGRSAWIIFGSASIIGTILFLHQVFKKPDTAAFRVAVPVSSVLERGFARSPHAGLIMERGRAVRANESYLELAAEYGYKSNDGVPPLPEKLFEHASDQTQSVIYRLSHLEDSEAFGEEEIEFWSDDDRLLRFLLRVTVFKSQQFWEIVDLSYDGTIDGQLLTKVPIGLFSVLENGQVVSSNDKFRDWVGISDLSSLDFRDFIDHPEGLLDSPKEPDRTVRFDTRLITQKGVATPIVLVANWHRAPSGRLIASCAVHGHSSLADSVALKSDNETPSQSVDATPESSMASPFAMLDLNTNDFKSAEILAANSIFAELAGIEDATGMALIDVLEPSAMGPNIFEVDAEQLTFGSSVEAGVKGREGIFVSIYSQADESTGRQKLYLVDVSARKALEDQLVQSQKMQAIGRLVAEIAHDFNNLLAAIRLYTDTLLGRHPIGDPSYPELQQINANGNRAAALVKKLLAYSRKQTIRAENLDVSETLSDMAVTLKQVLGEKVHLEIKHGRDLPPIHVDKSQFDTVLMNLAVNARDAMKKQGGGKITIESQSLLKSDIEKPGLKAALERVKSDRLVSISVADTGTGITEEIKNKIFEPFFTTKAQGEGTGLGLSTVYGIVQQSGGHLTVDSEIGQGTTFTIYLPEADKAVVEQGGPVAAPVIKSPPIPKAPHDLAGQGNILFVEDEASVRVIAAKTLRKRGYNVVEAGDGEEAYEIIEETETPFDLMISDVVMPGMDGPTLLKKARPMLAQTRIVFISGYAEEEFSELLAEEPDVTFLPKPFTLIQLAEKVKQQIGEAV
ncbi:MAG: response regulator [Hellea sp.]|nr:response regulator [Hellea sp.]